MNENEFGWLLQYVCCNEGCQVQRVEVYQSAPDFDPDAPWPAFTCTCGTPLGRYDFWPSYCGLNGTHAIEEVIERLNVYLDLRNRKATP